MKRWHFSVNLLGTGAVILMVASMFFPWWAFRWSFVEATYIFPYIVSGPGSEMIGYRRSPQMVLLTGVLIGTIVLCLVGSLLKGRAARVMLAISGVLALLCGWRLLSRVTGVAAEFGLPPNGHGWGGLGSFAKVEVWTWIQPGLYIILAAGVLALLAALLHPRVRLGGD